MRRLFWCFPFLWVMLSFLATMAWVLTPFLLESTLPLNWAILSASGPIAGLALGISTSHWRNSLKQSDHAQHQSRLISKTERATLEKTLSDDKIRVLEAKIQTLEMALQQSLKR